ncbi:unnamed protein product [marine sediment metagenome]|uniref:Uncharacterized protein n=1 Tax=marine sediment metagenome TaxID=412755 RepID=X1G0D7_9ZZZZ
MDNDEQKPNIKPKEICSIRIAFPIDSDDQAIEYKKKIGDVLSPISNVQIQFSIMSVPTRMPGSPDVPQIR